MKAHQWMASILRSLADIRPWWWWWRLCIILLYSWECNLSLPIACYYHRLKSVVMFCTKNGNTKKFIMNRLLHPLSREEDQPDFNHIWLCLPDQSKLDFVLEMNNIRHVQWTSMRQLMNYLLTSSKPCFVNLLPKIGITSMFMCLLVTKSTSNLWRIGNCIGTMIDIMAMQTVSFLILWRWRKWKTFQFMIT